jgi:hypothetical protein
MTAPELRALQRGQSGTGDLRRAEIPRAAREGLEAGGSTNIARWTKPGLSILMSRDPINDPRDVPDYRWHLSIAGEHDVPGWDTMVAIAHELRPGVCFVVGVPPRSWWINVHPHCLHLWETRDPNLEAQWRSERRGHTPS